MAKTKRSEPTEASEKKPTTSPKKADSQVTGVSPKEVEQSGKTDQESNGPVSAAMVVNGVSRSLQAEGDEDLKKERNGLMRQYLRERASVWVSWFSFLINRMVSRVSRILGYAT